MKRILLVSLSVLVLIITLSGCAKMQRNIKDFQSDISGLDRTITLYSYDGEIINQWETKTTVRTEGGFVDWIGDDGNRIIISGTVIIKEK